MEPLSLVLTPVYTRVIPFELTFSGVQGEGHVVWNVDSGAAFELAALTARCDVAMDLNVCDTHSALPIGFLQLLPGAYLPLDLGGGRVRSASYTGSRLVLVDPVGGAVVHVKGCAYGYELTREGRYK
jgi:hypothetical protein